MRTATAEHTRVDRLQDGDWLYRLLGDIRDEVARRPSRRAVERIRGRLLAQMKTPARAAA